MTTLPQIPGYRIETELGRGGMGVVYKCWSESQPHPLAMKLMLRGRRTGFQSLARFRIEAEALRCLDHENIIKVHDVGAFAGTPFLVTEFAAEGTLKEFLVANPKPVDWIVATIRTVALALHHAHLRRILHRDIKPANILMMEDGTPKLSDFGLVKFTAPIEWVNEACVCAPFAPRLRTFDEELKRAAAELQFEYQNIDGGQFPCVEGLVKAYFDRIGVDDATIDEMTVIEYVANYAAQQSELHDDDRDALALLHDLTEEGGIMGSPQFMSPEQAAGREDLIGPPTDVYSLGATLYCLATGSPMFAGSRTAEVLEKVRNEWPKKPREVRSDIPEGVDAVIWKCIQKEPQRRYQDCESLADELQRCLDGRQPLTLLRRKLRDGAERTDSCQANERWNQAFSAYNPGVVNVSESQPKRWWQFWR